MIVPTRIHHLNFVVHDLAEATRRFEQLLGVSPFEIVEHVPRRSTIARTRIGESWLVLVCPKDSESVPGRFLAQHGEGFFLLSVGVENLEERLANLVGAGVDVIDRIPRSGILDWNVADIDQAYGAVLQLTADGNVPG